MGELTHEGSRKNFLGNNPSDEMIRKTCVENLVDKSYPPTFVWYSTADETVNPENSRMLIQALADNGVKHKCMEFKTVPHGAGLGIGSECEPWFNEAVHFWLDSCSQQS